MKKVVGFCDHCGDPVYDFQKRIILHLGCYSFLMEAATVPKSVVRPDTQTRTNCAILDEACVDCTEDCPAAGTGKDKS